MIELKISLQPKQRLFAQSIEDFPVTFFGGAKGGGKSHGLRNIFLLRRFKYEGSVGAIFRKTYPELEANHIRPMFAQFPALKEYWNESKKLLTLPNHSTLQFCHCESERDVGLYQGREFHDLGIEEAGQWPETTVNTLRGSNRSSKAGIKARTALTGNPGGIGHKWLKRIFVEKRFKPRERPGDYNFIQALVDDNAALIHNDPDYVYRLESEPNEALRQAYRYGSWDIFAGQFFSEISRERHVVSQFNIPAHWNRFGAYDYGFNHPAAFGWFAVDEDGNVVMYRELIQAKLRVDQFADKVASFPDTKDLMVIPAGLDCWAKKATIQAGTTPTVAEEFMKRGIVLSPARVDRIQGANQIRNFLAWQDLADEREIPRFRIMDNCPITFDCLTRMEHDPNRVEDVLKIDATEGDPMSGDDSYDMVRYGLMSRPVISEPARKKLTPGSDAYAADMAKRMEESVIEKMKKAHENKGNPDMNWQVDQDMTPSWNKWD